MVVKWGLDLLDIVPVIPHVLRAIPGLHPDTWFVRQDLAVAVQQHPTAGSIAQIFWTGHRAGHAGVVQHTLPAHTAVKNRPFAHLFHRYEEAFTPAIRPQQTAERNHHLVGSLVSDLQ